MAATNNVNLLLNTQSNSNKVNPASSIRSTYFARKTYNVNRNSSGSFNNVLDRINSAPQQNPAPRDTYKSSSVESNAKSSSNDVRTHTTKNDKSVPTQKEKAPENVKPKEQFDDDDAQSESGAPQTPVNAAMMFSTGMESLLPVREMPVEGEPVLMTVMPQQSNSNNQSMLNMLAGNTWRQLQPTAVEQPTVIEPEQLIPTVEEPIAQPLIDVNPLQPSTIVEADVQPQQAASLIGGENVELNQLPVEGEKPKLIQVRGDQNPIDQSAIQSKDQPLIQSKEQAPIQPTVIEEGAPVQTPVQSAQPLMQNQAATNDVSFAQSQRQPIVETADATAQTQVVSNDANLSNVIDAAKNSQPRAVASDIQAPVEQIAVDNVEMPLEPTDELASLPTVERRGMAQDEQPLTPIAKPDRPAFVEPQQPVQTQQSVDTQPTQIVNPQTQEVQVEGINQPITPQPDQQPRTPLATNQPVIEQPTAPVQTEVTATVEQPVIQQSTAQPTQSVQTAQPEQIQQPIVEQPAQINVEQPEELKAPTNTQQIFDENNGVQLPRGTQDINQPTTRQATQPVQDEVAQPVAANVTEADAEPVHRRFHGHDNQLEAAQLEQTRQSAWRDRTAPLYQIALQQRTAAQSNNPLASGTPTAGNVTTASPVNPTSNAQPLNVAAQNVAAQNVILGEEVSAPNAAAPSNNVVAQNVAAPDNPTAIVQPLNVDTQNVAAPNAPSAQPLNNIQPQSALSIDNPLANAQNVLSSAENATPVVNGTAPVVQPQSVLQTDYRTATPQPFNTHQIENVQPQNVVAGASIDAPRANVPAQNVQPQNQSAINIPSTNAQPLNTQTANIQPQIPTPDAQPFNTHQIENVQLQNVSAPSNPIATNAQPLNTQTVQPQSVLQTDYRTATPQPFNTHQIENVQPQNVSAPSNPIATNAQPLSAPTVNPVSQNNLPFEQLTAPQSDVSSTNVQPQNQSAINIPSAPNQPLNSQTEIIQPQNISSTERTLNAPAAVSSNNIPIQNVAAPDNPTAIVQPLNVDTQNVAAPNNPIAPAQTLNVRNNNVAAPEIPSAANQPLNAPTNEINPQNISAAQLQGSVAQTDQTVNRPVNNIPQSFAIFGNELDINNPVTAAQQAAPFNQQSNQQQPNQQFNQQSNQQSQQQAQQQVQQQVQQAVNAQAQTQAQAMPMVEGQAATAQMPSESFAQNLGTAINNLNTPQPAQNAQPSTPNTAFAQQLRDDFNVAGQIVEHARMFRNALNNSTEMVLQLRPEHLGELTLRVSVTAEGTVNASFHSDNAAVRAIIENSLVSLKQELSNQGLKVDNVEVYSGLSDGGSLMNGKGRQGWQQNNRRNAQRVERVRGGNASEGGGNVQGTATAQTVETSQPVEQSINEGGVDYKV